MQSDRKTRKEQYLRTVFIECNLGKEELVVPVYLPSFLFCTLGFNPLDTLLGISHSSSQLWAFFWAAGNLGSFACSFHLCVELCLKSSHHLGAGQHGVNHLNPRSLRSPYWLWRSGVPWKRPECRVPPWMVSIVEYASEMEKQPAFCQVFSAIHCASSSTGSFQLCEGAEAMSSLTHKPCPSKC